MESVACSILNMVIKKVSKILKKNPFVALQTHIYSGSMFIKSSYLVVSCVKGLGQFDYNALMHATR